MRAPGLQSLPLRPATSVELQRALDAFNKWRFGYGLSPRDDDGDDRNEVENRNRELRYVEGERARVGHRACESPDDPDAFVAWFDALETSGPGQHDPLFDWLEKAASLDQLTWVLRQEIAGEAGFDDLATLAQVKGPGRPRLSLAGNIMEMAGGGTTTRSGGAMLSQLAAGLGVALPAPAEIVPEALAQANLLSALAAHRRYAYPSIGALGVIELTAPGRVAKFCAGLERLGQGTLEEIVSKLTIDLRPGPPHPATDRATRPEAWNRDVLRALVAADPRVARPLAEGALMRLEAGARCFDRYRWDLWGATV